MPSSKLIKRVLLSAVGLGIVILLYLAFQPQPVAVDVAQVVRGPLLVTVDEEGRTRIRERYTVSAPLAGDLSRIRLKAGDPVEAGHTLLATIEPVDPVLLDARTRAQAEAKLKAAVSTLAQAKTNLSAAQAAEEFARAEYRRMQQLAETRAHTQAELERHEMLLRMRVEELRSTEFAVQIAEFEREQAEAALLRTRTNREGPPSASAEPAPPARPVVEANGAAPQPPAPSEDDWRIDIRSPIDGRVLKVVEESAKVVAAGQPLIEVGDPRDLEVEVDVLSTDAVKIEPGARVLLEHWGGTQAIPARVRRVEPAAFTKISALGVEEQRVWVKIDFVESAGERPPLGDAYRVEARIVTWEGDDVLKIPTSSLLRHGEDWAVFKIVDGRARLQVVQAGHRNNYEVEILDGLQAGDEIIEHPSDKVANGVRVARRQA